MRPEETLGHKFRIINNMIDKYMDAGRQRDNSPVSRAQGTLIHYLYNRQDLDTFQKDIEEVFCISGATASNMLKSMEKNGIIQRIPMPEDARLKKIVLTEKAIKQDVRAKNDIERMEACITSGMTQEEAATLERLLSLAMENVTALVSSGGEDSAGKN